MWTEPPSPSHPWSEGLPRRERNVLIFRLGEVVLSRNGLLSGRERGVRLALFMCRIDQSEGPQFLNGGLPWVLSEELKHPMREKGLSSPKGIIRGAQSWAGATGCKEAPIDLGDSEVNHFERPAPFECPAAGV